VKDNLVTVEMWKDPKIRETLNIVDCFMFRDKTQPSGIEDTRKPPKENQS